MASELYNAFMRHVVGDHTHKLLFIDSEGVPTTALEFELDTIPKDKHTYFTPGIRQEVDAVSNKIGGKLDVAFINALWLDFDDPDLDLYELIERWVKPTYVVESGSGGFHFYWILQDPIEDLNTSEYYFSYLLELFPEADPKPAHWASQMRLPWSWNIKHDPPVQVKLHKMGDVIQLPAKDTHEVIQMRSKIVSLGGRATGWDSADSVTTYRRPVAPGEECSNISAQLFPSGEARNGTPTLVVYTSNWEGLPEGTYSYDKLMNLGKPSYSAHPIDPLAKEVERVVEQAEIKERAKRIRLFKQCEELGVITDPSYDTFMLETLVRNKQQINLLENDQGSGLDRGYKLQSFGEIIDSPVAGDNWVIEDLIGKGDITALAAQPKTGKTTLVMSMIKALCEGTTLWGHKVQKPLRVATLDFEMRAHEIKNQYMKNASKAVRENAFSMMVGATETENRLDLFSPNTCEDLKKLFAENHIDFLVVDPLLEAVYGTQVDKISEGDIANQNNVITRFLEAVKDIAPPFGAFVVHHTNSDGAFHGAKVLERKPQALWYLTAPEVDAPKDLTIKGRSTGHKQLKLKYDKTTNLLYNINTFK